MGNSCFEKRPVIPKEKRTYKELVIEALQSGPLILAQTECIINIDIDPQHSKLNEMIKLVLQEEKEKESNCDDLSEMSERGDENLDLELGIWKVQKLRKRLFRHTNYIAHLKIDTDITQENMIKIYQELFSILAQKNIQYVVMPQMWMDNHQYKVTMRENSDALFDQLFTWRNQDQKYRATFIVFHTETAQAIQIVDSFLMTYNQYNPVILEDQSAQSNHLNDEDVEEDQKMLL
ncbi:unnamed protein product [Paramecium primaurelia]|uniref:Uncharacterized protein n=1 Tax=Paramecium primaurelia TaxID=5886 RepID=A0A8S1LYE6_PARPR|nr:unnamed protein product [Paramecium primaurelia]CAD8073790.1 unnamed protein product [Paramecium primaurelia]